MSAAHPMSAASHHPPALAGGSRPGLCPHPPTTATDRPGAHRRGGYLWGRVGAGGRVALGGPRPCGHASSPVRARVPARLCRQVHLLHEEGRGACLEAGVVCRLKMLSGLPEMAGVRSSGPTDGGRGLGVLRACGMYTAVLQRAHTRLAPDRRLPSPRCAFWRCQPRCPTPRTSASGSAHPRATCASTATSCALCPSPRSSRQVCMGAGVAGGDGRCPAGASCFEWVCPCLNEAPAWPQACSPCTCVRQSLLPPGRACRAHAGLCALQERLSVRAPPPRPRVQRRDGALQGAPLARVLQVRCGPQAGVDVAWPAGVPAGSLGRCGACRAPTVPPTTRCTNMFLVAAAACCSRCICQQASLCAEMLHCCHPSHSSRNSTTETAQAIAKEAQQRRGPAGLGPGGAAVGAGGPFLRGAAQMQRLQQAAAATKNKALLVMRGSGPRLPATFVCTLPTATVHPCTCMGACRGADLDAHPMPASPGRPAVGRRLPQRSHGGGGPRSD